MIRRLLDRLWCWWNCGDLRRRYPDMQHFTECPVDLAREVVLHELPWSFVKGRGHWHGVCAPCAAQLASRGEETWHDQHGMGGAPQCCMCAARPTKGDGWYSTMRRSEPRYDYVFVGGENDGHTDVRPVGTVTEMAWYVRSRIEHYEHPRCDYCVTCIERVGPHERETFCPVAGDKCIERQRTAS